MKKFLAMMIMAASLSATAVYAEKEVFLPEAQSDFVYASVPGDSPEPSPEPSPEMTSAPDKAPEPTASPVPSETPYPAPTAIPVPTSTKFSVDFTMESLPRNCTAEFAIYDKDELLDTAVCELKSSEKSFRAEFDVPEYTAGKEFDIVCVRGARAVRYYDSLYAPYEKIRVETYCYDDDEGNQIAVFSAAMNIVTDKKINIYIGNQAIETRLSPQLIDTAVMVPVRETAAVLDADKVEYHADYDSVSVAAGKSEVLFNVGKAWSSVGKKVIPERISAVYIDDTIFVPLYTLADFMGCSYQSWEHEQYIDIVMTESKYVRAPKKVKYITDSKLKSETDYLIWISKKNYEVNIFKRVGGIWRFDRVFDCAIGTNETPTCVGTYRYYEKIDRWLYPDFYVAPVMRFNGGYAIHSTLIRYDGTDYNPSVRKKLSHGCVRVRRDDMAWLIDNIPMYTTIHVTNE